MNENKLKQLIIGLVNDNIADQGIVRTSDESKVFGDDTMCVVRGILKPNTQYIYRLWCSISNLEPDAVLVDDKENEYYMYEMPE